jgi:hypothetical protein
MVLSDDDDGGSDSHATDTSLDQEASAAENHKEEAVVKLVSKVAGKKSNWKIVEKEFIQVR